MSKPSNDNPSRIVFMVVGMPIAILVADMIGRMRALFIHEWPFISWGLFILIAAAGVSFLFLLFEAQLEQRLDYLHRKLSAFDAALAGENSRVKDGFKEAKEQREGLDRIISRQRQDIIKLQDEFRSIRKLLEYKRPVESEAAQARDIVSAAADELTAGA